MTNVIDTALINLQKSKLASCELNKRTKYKIVLITEPYVHDGNVALLDKTVGNLYYALNEDPRACIRITPDLNPWIVNEFTSKDICCVAANIEGRMTYIASAYLDINLSAIPKMMSDLIDCCNQKGIPLLIGMDSNAHSALWGCDVSNGRGHELESLIAEKDLTVLNEGSRPTFETVRAESIIDVTMVNSAFYNTMNVNDWQVLGDEPSFSDHKYITFSWGKYIPAQRQYRNLKKANWSSFKELTKTNSLPIINSDGSNLDDCALSLKNLIDDALEVVCPMRNAFTKKPNPWWNGELSKLRSEVRHLENVKNNSENNYKKYRKSWSNYRKAVNKAKKESWRNFCTKAENAKDVTKIIKSLKSKSPKGIGLLKQVDGTFCRTPKESLAALMDAHFLESVEVTDQEGVDESHNVVMNESAPDDVEEFITPTKVRDSIGSFGPMKAPGPDNFKPIILQNLHEETYKYISDIYKSIVRSGYTPSLWREMKVIFLAKEGKTEYCVPKSYRPITLSNFLLKGLERILQWYINEKIITKPLYSQHAYTKGRSCDTALTEVVDIIEKAISRKEKALVVSLDCSGAFDRIQFTAAAAAMKRRGIPKTIEKWYDKLLRERSVEAELQGEKSKRKPKRGSPQGGILSTLIWILIMDTLLSTFEGKAVKAIGYSDDVFLVITGKDIATLVNIMQQSLDDVTKWGESNGLVFNPDKTSVVLFTKSTRRETCKNLYLKGVELSYSDSLKYLGVTLNKRLTWTEHVNSRVKKGMQLFNLSRAIIGQNWGLTPDKIMWLYTAVIRPMVTYGCLVWGKLLSATARNGLKRLQRQSLLSLSHPLRSTPTDGMEVALGLLPLDLHVEAEGIKARLRTRTQVNDRWDGLGVHRAEGHRRYWDTTLNKICPTSLPMDKITKVMNWERPLEIKNPDVVIYTDGSKETGNVGCGWAVCVGDTVIAEDFRYLGKSSTVFQSEIVAISDSLLWLISNAQKLGDKKSCLIRSDSQSAIAAIYSNKIENKTVLDCVNFLKTANKSFQVTIEWIKGHDDATGNEYADYLAKAGNSRITEVTEPVIPVPMTTIKAKIEDLIVERWQNRWNACEEQRVTKHFFTKVNVKKCKRLVKLARQDLNLLFQACTGHGLFRGHLAKWRDVDPTCQLCLEDEEKADHLWSECPALWNERRERQSEHTRQKYFELDVIKFFKAPSVRDMMTRNGEETVS